MIAPTIANKYHNRLSSCVVLVLCPVFTVIDAYFDVNQLLFASGFDDDVLSVLEMSQKKNSSILYVS
jgi:hypothetical protein